MSMVEATEKTCLTCKKEKPLSEFTSDKQKKTGLTPYCKECCAIASRRYYENHKEQYAKAHKEWREKNPQWKPNPRGRNATLKCRYNISESDYNDMFIEQGGRCAICGKHQSKCYKTLHVDHCHETDKVRGLLCGKCNRGLGMFSDSISLFHNVIKYLEMNK